MRSRGFVILWDFLAWILVLFPLVTGGIWLHRPGLKIEHTQLAAPVLILFFLGWLFRSRFGADLERASSVRLARGCWRRWKFAVARRPLPALSVGAAISSALLIAVSVRRHLALESHAFDLGIFTNGMWNLVHGNGYFSSVRDMRLFADHQSFIVWVLAPIFSLAPSPLALLVVQGLALGFGGVLVFFLARQYLDRDHWGCYALPLLYWAYFPFRTANAFDFHPEVLMLPFFLGALVGLQSRRGSAKILGLLSLILAMTCKETAPALAAGIALAWISGAAPSQSRGFTRRLAFLVLPISVAWFFFDLKVVPKLLGSEHVYLANSLSRYGGSLTDLITAPILAPKTFWPQIFGVARIKYLFMTLAPLAFLPLFSWRQMIPALPGYLMLFLTEGDHRVSIQYHYAIEPGVALFWAMPAALAAAQAGVAPRLLRRLARPTIVLFFALALFDRSPIFFVRKFTPTPKQEWLRTEVIPCMDRDLALASSSALIPHLSARPWAHEIPKLERDDGAPVSCVLYDPEVGNWSMEGKSWDELEARLKASYLPVFECGSTKVYQLGIDSRSCMSCVPSCGDFSR